MELDRDTIVLTLLGAILVIEVVARLAMVLLPARIVLLRKGSWWRWLRYLQALLLLLAVAGVYSAYRYPTAPPGLLERWLEEAEVLVLPVFEEADWTSPAFASREGGETGAQSVMMDFLRGRVVKVIDGDSIILKLREGDKVESRLHGVDAPEWDQPHGSAARRALAWKVLWRSFDVEVRDVDGYGRKVVVLRKEGRNINAEMVCDGHAWWYTRYAPKEMNLQRCQASARNLGIGLWKDGDPLPPWKWRRR
jgi:endonuclease YncB( thermonuclease family)